MLPNVEVGETVRVPVNGETYIKTYDGRIIPISSLLEFHSSEEASQFRNNLTYSTNIFKRDFAEILPLETSGDVTVYTLIVGGGTIKLRVAYRTSGNANTGTIIYHNAYTTHTGITHSIAWEEKECYSQITSSGKDIYAYAAGEIVGYLLVDGFIEINRDRAVLEGTAFVVR